MDFVSALGVIRELRIKLNYITDLLEQLTEKVNLIELTLNVQPMSTNSDSEEKCMSPPPPQ